MDDTETNDDAPAEAQPPAPGDTAAEASPDAETPAGEDTAGEPGPRTSTPLAGWPLVAALVLLVFWLVALVFLSFESDTNETQWARLAFLLGSLEAVVFAAAGAMFGTTVQRQRVEAAEKAAEKSEKQAEKAEERAKEKEKAAENGKALATAIKVSAADDGAGRGRSQDLSGENAGGGGSSAGLLRLANELFPD